MPKPLLLLTSCKPYEPIESIKAAVEEAIQKPSGHFQYAFALPYSCLKEMTTRHDYSHVLFGALQMGGIDEGVFTRPVAGKMLKQAGASFVLIGTSFERRYAHQEEVTCRLKIQEALKEGMTPILCVGESGAEHLEERGAETVEAQLKVALQDFSVDDLCRITVFFESPWIEQLPFRPEELVVAKTYERNKTILAKVVGKEVAEQMLVVFPALEGNVEASLAEGRGIFIHHHYMGPASEKLSEAAAAAEEEKLVAAAEEGPSLEFEEGVVPKLSQEGKELVSEEDAASEPQKETVLSGNKEPPMEGGGADDASATAGEEEPAKQLSTKEVFPVEEQVERLLPPSEEPPRHEEASEERREKTGFDPQAEEGAIESSQKEELSQGKNILMGEVASGDLEAGLIQDEVLVAEKVLLEEEKIKGQYTEEADGEVPSFEAQVPPAEPPFSKKIQKEHKISDINP